MGGAATHPCRGSTLGKPRLQELNLPMGCSLVAWKLNSYFYPPKLRDFTCLSVLGSSYQLLSSDTDHHRLEYVVPLVMGELRLGSRRGTSRRSLAEQN
jgi:hypothetical protein